MKRILLLIMFLQILVVTQAGNVSLGMAASPEPKVLLGTLTFPEKVLPSQEFEVNISVTYFCKERTMSNIGIYDFGSEMIREPRVFFLEGNGSKSFQFNFQAAPTESEMKYEALLRYWYNGGWVYENKSLQQPFSVRVTDEISMRIILPEPDSKIKLDEMENQTDSYGVFTSTVKPGRHLINVPREINLTKDSRLIFLRWSDGSTSNPTVTEIQGDTNLTAQYETEYYLTVRSNLGETQGEGWYPSGSTATFSVPRSVQNSILKPAEENVFKKWSGDSDAVTSTAQITMTSPKNVVAQWQISQTANFAIPVIPIALIIMIIDTGMLAYIVLRRRRSGRG
jgi:hypothetical protein